MLVSFTSQGRLWSFFIAWEASLCFARHPFFPTIVWDPWNNSKFFASFPSSFSLFCIFFIRIHCVEKLVHYLSRYCLEERTLTELLITRAWDLTEWRMNQWTSPPPAPATHRVRSLEEPRQAEPGFVGRIKKVWEKCFLEDWSDREERRRRNFRACEIFQGKWCDCGASEPEGTSRITEVNYLIFHIIEISQF